MLRLKLMGALMVATSLVVVGCRGRSNAEDERGFSLPQSPLLSAFERKAGLIAYTGIDGNVYIVDQGGKNLKQITTDGKMKKEDFHYYEFPAWAPDGKSLAFYGVKGTSQTDVVASVYTSDTQGKMLTQAYTSDRHVPIYLSWSPDSSKVTFIASIEGSNNLMLNMVPAVGGEAQVLDVGQPYYWAWLPDSSGVVVHRDGPATRTSDGRLAVLSLADGVVEDALAVKPAFFQSPALSPDGSQLLVAIQDDEGKNTLAITDTAGNVQSVVATLTGSVSFAWSPDGQRVAYIASEDDSQLAVGKMTVVELGETPKSVETEHDTVVAFFWAPDSKRLAYFAVAQITPTPDPEAPDAVPEEARSYLKMYVTDGSSSDGKFIAPFVPTNDFLRIIPYFDQYSRSTTIWSPDSQNLVLSAYTPEGAPGIYVVPASGLTAPRFLQDGTIAFWSTK